MKSRRGRRNAGDTMSKVSSLGGHSGATAANAQTQAQAAPSLKTVVLEAASSAEVASYDYDAALSQPDFEQYYSIKNEKSCRNDTVVEEKKQLPVGRGRSVISRTSPLKKTPVGTMNRTGKSAGNVVSNHLASKKSEPCPSVSEEGEAEEEESETAAESDVPLTMQKVVLPTNETVIAGKGRKHVQSPSGSRAKDVQTTAKTKIGSKEDTGDKKATINSSVLDYNSKNSKIPRATCTVLAASCATAAARVCPVAHTPSKIKSKHSVTVRPFTARTKPPTSNTGGALRRPVSSKPADSPRIRSKTSKFPKEDLRPRSTKTSRSSLRKGLSPEPEAEPEMSPETRPIPDRYPMFSSAEESPEVVGSAGDPSAMSVLRNLRLNCPCRSCNDQRETVNLELSIHDVHDPWSDSRSSPEMRSGSKRWPNAKRSLKNLTYVNSSSEEVDISSDYSSDNLKPKKKRSVSEVVSPVTPFAKSSFFPHPPRIRTQRRTRFSFFNTLFDIVFWPFLFLRTNR